MKFPGDRTIRFRGRKIRWQLIDGEVWLRHEDVAAVLGLKADHPLMPSAQLQAIELMDHPVVAEITALCEARIGN